MKKLVALLISVALLCGSVSALADGTFEMDAYTSPNVFTVEVDSDNDIAFIDTQMGNDVLSFSHKYENDYYSVMRNDILVINQSSASRYPVLRTWITYRGTKALNFSSISFIIDDKEYVLTDVASADRNSQEDNNFEEILLIKYGYQNWDLFAALAATALSYYGDWVEDKETAVPDIKVILHGTEDIEVNASGNFLLDLGVFVLSMYSADTLGMLVEIEGTPCQVIEK